MFKNEETKIKYQRIAIMALIGLYDRYLEYGNKENLCVDLELLIDFTHEHDCLDGLLVDTVYSVITREDLLPWLKERLTKE